MGLKDIRANIPDISDVFPQVNDDLHKVTWGHAVNNKADLDKHIEDKSIMMLEADLVLGHVIGDDTRFSAKPIMAHPPAVFSDLSFEMWLDAVIRANEVGKKKGVKLDFKDISVVEDCLNILQDRIDDIDFPLWLNADILKGPVDATKDPVDADKFLDLCAEFSQATLSLGWTTLYTTPDDEKAMYSKEMVEEMAQLVETKRLSHALTFPIRAAFVKRSIKNLEWLLENAPDSSITVWSSSEDSIDIPSLVSLRDAIGQDSVYYDLPKEQKIEFDNAMDAEVAAAAPSFQILPHNTSTWATVGIALASALAALYLYD